MSSMRLMYLIPLGNVRNEGGKSESAVAAMATTFRLRVAGVRETYR